MFVGLSLSKEPIALFHNTTDHLLFNKEREEQGKPVVCYVYEVDWWVPPSSAKHLVGQNVTLYNNDGSKIYSQGILFQEVDNPKIFTIANGWSFHEDDVTVRGTKVFFSF